MAVIEALHGGRLVQRNMNEIGEPTVKPVARPGIFMRISPPANIKSVPVDSREVSSFHGLFIGPASRRPAFSLRLTTQAVRRAKGIGKAVY